MDAVERVMSIAHGKSDWEVKRNDVSLQGYLEHAHDGGFTDIGRHIREGLLERLLHIFQHGFHSQATQRTQCETAHHRVLVLAVTAKCIDGHYGKFRLFASIVS